MLETRFTAASTSPTKWVIMDLGDLENIDILSERPLFFRQEAEYLATKLNEVAAYQPEIIDDIVEVVKRLLNRGIIDDVVPLAKMQVWFNAQTPEVRHELHQKAEQESAKYGGYDKPGKILRRLIQAAIEEAKPAHRLDQVQ